MKTLNYHVCRCCLSRNCFKDISNEYYIGGKKEVYSEMIFETFNLNINYQNDSTRLICEDCITQLRHAAEFRNQIVRSEELLMSKLHNQDSGSELVTKVEIKDDFLDHITGEFDDESSNDDDNQFGDNHVDIDENWQDDDETLTMKLESKGCLNLDSLNLDSLNLVANKAKTQEKRTQKVTKSSSGSKKRIHSSGQAKKLDIRNITEDSNENIDGPIMEKLGKRKISKNGGNPSTKSKHIKTSSISQSQRDMQQNSLLLINNSNLCLFESLKTKFRCFYCKESYMDIKELRKHATIHSNPKYLKMCIKRMRGMSNKNVDISNLSCKLCSESLIHLNDLKTHLIEEHKLEFSNEKHLLIPYKLEDGFNCVNCNEKYNTFHRLSVHMNTHYTNNVCEICGVSYINRISLRTHVSSVHKEKKCSKCSAVFQNNYSRVKHMRTVHNTSRSQRYCLLCNKTFRYTYMLNEHKIQEHGAKRQISSCVECGKTFLTPQNLRIHVRSVHIKERNYPCSLCGMRFFTKCDQMRHERTHQDVRSFACSYCEGRFKSKDSLRRHLRRQHGHIF